MPHPYNDRNRPAIETNSPAATTDAVITLAAVASKSHAVYWIAYGYSAATGTAGGETLIVLVNAVEVFRAYVTNSIEGASGPHVIHFGDTPIVGEQNQAIVITLTAPTAGSGTVSAGTQQG